MFKSFLAGCLSLILCSGLGFGQQATAEDKQLAEQNLAIEFNGIADQIKAIDEPALRILLRLRAAQFLWSKKSEAASGIAEGMATEAMADVQNNESQIPGFYKGLFRRELLAALELHAPALAAQLVKKYDLDNSSNRFDTAFELLNDKNGVETAVAVMRRNIQGGRELSNSKFTFFLNRLDEVQPAALTQLLAEIISAAERAPSNYSVTSLFDLAHYYLYRRTTPSELKARFLTLFISASRNPSILSQAEQMYAFNLLKANLPAIEKLLPTLYPQAASQVATLSSFLPRETLERSNIDDSIRNSTDPLERTISEADNTKDEVLKRNLLSEAARTALEKGQLKLAVDLIMRIEPRDEDKDNFVLYRDQFLGDVVRKAAEKKDAAVIDYAISKIQHPLKRASAMQRLVLYYYEAQDFGRAREILNNVLKTIESVENSAHKASGLLNLAAFSLKVDDQLVPDITQAAIKILNSLPGAKPEDKPESESHQKYVETLLQLAYNVIPVFQRLAQKDKFATLNLANSIQRREIKVSALLGSSMTMPARDRDKTQQNRPKKRAP